MKHDGDRIALLVSAWVLMTVGPLLVWLVGYPAHPWGAPALSFVVAIGLVGGAVSVDRQGRTVDPPLPRRVTTATVTVAVGALLVAALWYLL